MRWSSQSLEQGGTRSRLEWLSCRGKASEEWKVEAVDAYAATERPDMMEHPFRRENEEGGSYFQTLKRRPSKFPERKRVVRRWVRLQSRDYRFALFVSDRC